MYIINIYIISPSERISPTRLFHLQDSTFMLLSASESKGKFGSCAAPVSSVTQLWNLVCFLRLPFHFTIHTYFEICLIFQ
jgi:hypothetical protein